MKKLTSCLSRIRCRKNLVNDVNHYYLRISLNLLRIATGIMEYMTNVNESLMAYNRTKNGTLEKKVVENCNSIIEDITYCNDVIISSHRYQVMEKKYDDFFGLLLWEDPHTILTLNKGYIKKIDMRTSEFVHICDTSSIPEWGYDNLTCFSSDYLYTIMTGTRNGKVILWDQRKSAPIQMYQMSPTKPPDSYLNDNIRSDQYDRKNIRSIQFDSTHLYAVTYETLIEFDFKKKDYLDHENIKNILLNYF
ncbi:uncharacterized protein [Linepithema humile]|uniref:uncharacterized protein isoform X5 n=1 Tax=Linepithema humile TaxID=83485 RepID=UPI00351DF26A